MKQELSGNTFMTDVQLFSERVNGKYRRGPEKIRFYS